MPVCQAELLRRCQVLDDEVDILFGQRLCRGRHVAVHVEARPCLETAKLRTQVIGLLPHERGNVLLTAQLRSVAGDTVEFLGEPPAFFSLGRTPAKAELQSRRGKPQYQYQYQTQTRRRRQRLRQRPLCR